MKVFYCATNEPNRNSFSQVDLFRVLHIAYRRVVMLGQLLVAVFKHVLPLAQTGTADRWQHIRGLEL